MVRKRQCFGHLHSHGQGCAVRVLILTFEAEYCEQNLHLEKDYIKQLQHWWFIPATTAKKPPALRCWMRFGCAGRMLTVPSDCFDPLFPCTLSHYCLISYSYMLDYSHSQSSCPES